METRLYIDVATLDVPHRRALEEVIGRLLAGFLRTVGTSEVFPIGMTVLLRAAELWANASVGGLPYADADLIIAATALEHGRVLVTGNTPHFTWIPGLRLDDWRQP